MRETRESCSEAGISNRIVSLYPYHLKFLPRRIGFGLAVTAIRHRELTICLRVKLDPACGQVPIDIDNEGLGSVLSFRGIF